MGKEYLVQARWMSDPTPIDHSILAIICCCVSTAAAAHEAIAKARVLMAPCGTPSPFAKEEEAKALIAEVERLLGTL